MLHVLFALLIIVPVQAQGGFMGIMVRQALNNALQGAVEARNPGVSESQASSDAMNAMKYVGNYPPAKDFYSVVVDAAPYDAQHLSSLASIGSSQYSSLKGTPGYSSALSQIGGYLKDFNVSQAIMNAYDRNSVYINMLMREKPSPDEEGPISTLAGLGHSVLDDLHVKNIPTSIPGLS